MGEARARGTPRLAPVVIRRRFIVALGAASFTTACGGGTAARVQPSAPQSVLFICEHGYAKSLVAALHFERMASVRRLDVRAFSRGVDPGAAVPALIRDGLAADGFGVAGLRPTRATRAEVEGADYIVLFGVAPDLGAHSARVLHWDDISPLTVDYARAREEIVAHCVSLLERLQSAAADR